MAETPERREERQPSEETTEGYEEMIRQIQAGSGELVDQTLLREAEDWEFLRDKVVGAEEPSIDEVSSAQREAEAWSELANVPVSEEQPLNEHDQELALKAGLEEWMNKAEPVLSELQAASTLTQEDLTVRINQ